MSNRISLFFSVRLKQSGFTLIEILISLTILVFLLAVLYQAFSSSSRLWMQQELFNEDKSRQAAAHRLFNDDFSELVSYEYQHAEGKYFFFSATPSKIFYVTRNGFGARNRGSYALFFALCYLRETEDGRQGLYLYKTPFPEKSFMQAFEEFIKSDNQERKFWNFPKDLEDNSVLIISDLDEAGFFYDQPALASPAEIEDAYSVVGSNIDNDPILLTKFPEDLRFSYKFREAWWHQYISVKQLPDPTARAPEAE